MHSINEYLKAGCEMPNPRNPSGIEKLSPRLNEQELFERFMSEFGGEDSQEFTDVIGNQLLIDRILFEKLNCDWKITKGERAPWLLYTAVNIKKPDEIWSRKGKQGGFDKLYYLSKFDAGKKGFLSCIAVFSREQESSGLWIGRTSFATLREDGYLESKRKIGKLKYWRWEQ